ncbi:MAG: non-ribosomal peptide synthetase, partial [Planctomycetaceae bacterium]
MVVAMLAIWKAGGAWLPLDPRLPPARQRTLVTDSGLALALVDHDHAPQWQTPGLQVLDLRTSHHAAAPASQPFPSDDPHRLAYILYTSGSTGRPKGVEITHGALTNLLLAMRDQPGCRPDDAVLAITTFTFDISILDLFLPLVCGARLVLAEADAVFDPARLSQLINRHRVTLAQATPATWRMLLQADWRSAHPLKALCGGEALSADLADDLAPRVTELWNVYGPTETTIWSTVARVGSTTDTTSIGRPIHNTRVYILDERRRLVPPGQVGELWIAGHGVARGYRGQPDLTAQRFTDDPFTPTPDGPRMYATGDLAKWQPDGTLTCLGRIDHQVKIRGFRIELGEIETLLRSQPDVAGAVVTLSTDGQQRLVAHVIPQPGTTPEPATLRDALRQQLPDYMVPQAVLLCDAFPLTSSGKIDRRALAAREVALPAATGRPPQTPLEQSLAQIWAELLQRESVDCDSSFFELGGHSLLAVRLAA